MNPFAQSMRALQSGSTRSIRPQTVRGTASKQSQRGSPEATKASGRVLGRLGLLCALVAGMTSGFAEAQSLVATVPSGPYPLGIAVNPTTNMVYVTDGDYKIVTAINGATNTATTIATSATTAGVAVNSNTNTIYVAIDASPGSVAVIDGATNAISTTISIPLIPNIVAVNSVKNQIYVSEWNGVPGGAYNILDIDGSTNNVVATISIPKTITSLAVDTTRNLIYAVNLTSPGDGEISVIDGSSNAITATIPVGYNDENLALDEATNTLYVFDAHGQQLYIIDGATDTATTVPFASGVDPTDLAVNPATDSVYVATYDTNTSAGVMEVLNGSTNLFAPGFAFPAYAELLVNTTANQIWAAASPVEIIDGANNSVNTVTGTSGLTIDIGALNTTTNYGYMAGPNNVYVINGAASGPAFSASPSPLAFGNQTQGTTSSAMTLTVTNTGTADMTITTVTPGGTNMADFTIGADACANETVPAGKTCTVSVQFAPSTTSSESATLTFADNASDSPQIVNLTGTGVVPPATPTTTVLTASSVSVAVGTSVTFTATVTSTTGTPTPTGTVTFKDGASTLGTGTLNGSGVATYSTSSLSVASHTITANYGGDARNLGSTSNALTVNVTLGSTMTALTASATSIAVGSSITFTATVTGTSGIPAPTGSVTFMNGMTTLGTGTLNGAGVATYSTSALAAGSVSVTAVYGGDTSNASSTSSAVAVTVWPGPPAFTVTLDPTNGSFTAGKDAVITITVTSVNGFNAATSLACSGLPKNSTGTFSSSNITPPVSGTATSTLSIATDVKPNSADSRFETSRSTPARSPLQHPVAISGALAAFLLLPLFGAKNRKLRRLLLTLSSAILIATVASLGMIGCGGGPTTPKGTYMIQVNATAGTLTESATYSLTVQ
jgi:hypothetical protein